MKIKIQTQTMMWSRIAKQGLEPRRERDSAIHWPKKIRHELQPLPTMAETPLPCSMKWKQGRAWPKLNKPTSTILQKQTKNYKFQLANTKWYLNYMKFRTKTQSNIKP